MERLPWWEFTAGQGSDISCCANLPRPFGKGKTITKRAGLNSARDLRTLRSVSLGFI